MDVHAYMPGTYVVGKLVEVETRGEYRTAFVLTGRTIVELDVAKSINDELDQHVDADVVCRCVYTVRWLDTKEGRRPSNKLRCVGIESERSVRLAEAA